MPSDKQDFFLVCLLFMRNNEFNLICVRWTTTEAEGSLHHSQDRGQKNEIDIPQEQQQILEMPTQDWTDFLSLF